jgi:antitoxin ParD1/3/4
MGLRAFFIRIVPSHPEHLRVLLPFEGIRFKWQLLPFRAMCASMKERRNCYAKYEYFPSGLAEGRYSSVSEYIRELIRADERRKAAEKLEAMLLEGLGGEATEFTKEDWGAIRSEALAKVKAKKQKVHG